MWFYWSQEAISNKNWESVNKVYFNNLSINQNDNLQPGFMSRRDFCLSFCNIYGILLSCSGGLRCSFDLVSFTDLFSSHSLTNCVWFEISIKQLCLNKVKEFKIRFSSEYWIKYIHKLYIRCYLNTMDDQIIR